jgi:hypothetical protein
MPENLLLLLMRWGVVIVMGAGLLSLLTLLMSAIFNRSLSDSSRSTLWTIALIGGGLLLFLYFTEYRFRL